MREVQSESAEAVNVADREETARRRLESELNALRVSVEHDAKRREEEESERKVTYMGKNSRTYKITGKHMILVKSEDYWQYIEIEEHFETHRLQRLDDRRPATGEQLLADLDSTQSRVKLPGQCQCGIAGWEIERYDNRSLAGHDTSSEKSARIVAENTTRDESLPVGSE